MKISIHGYHATIKQLTKDQIEPLLDIFGLYLCECTDTTDPNGKRRISFNLTGSGRTIQLYLPEHGNIYRDCKLNINGLYFETFPEFSLWPLLRFLVENNIKYNTRQLDVAFDDDQGVTKITDWVRIFDNPDSYCRGVFFKSLKKGEKQAPNVVRNKGLFVRAELGNIKGASNYATFYKRDSGVLRFELKIRNSDDVSSLFGAAAIPTAQDPTEFERKAMGLLSRHINIFTKKSIEKHAVSKRKSDLVLEPFWLKFLAHEPQPLTRSSTRPDLSANVTANQQKAAKALAARFYNHYTKYCHIMSDGEITSQIQEFVTKICESKGEPYRQLSFTQIEF